MILIKGNSFAHVFMFHSVHSPGAACPHPRVLPNLVAVVLSAVYSTFDLSDKLYVTVLLCVDRFVPMFSFIRTSVALLHFYFSTHKT